MKVMIVDKDAPGFVLLGRMDAVAGMRATTGNEIKRVNGESCLVNVGGVLKRKHEVAIDLKVALEYGWARSPANGSPPPAAPPRKTKRVTNARGEPKRDAAFWLAKAEGKEKSADRDLRPYDAKRVNKSNLAEYDYRITRAGLRTSSGPPCCARSRGCSPREIFRACSRGSRTTCR